MTSMQTSVALPLAGAADTSQAPQRAGNIAVAANFASHPAAQGDSAQFTRFFAVPDLNQEALEAMEILSPESVAELAAEGAADVFALDVLPSLVPLWGQNFDRHLNASHQGRDGHSQVAAADASAQIQALLPSAGRVGLAAADHGDVQPMMHVEALSVGTRQVAALSAAHGEVSALLERKVTNTPIVLEALNASATSIPGATSLASLPQVQKVTALAPSGAEQPLLHALSQRIQLQHAQGIDVATVRLDPPQWGSLEVRIQHGPVGVQVVMQASNPEVGRQLSGMAEGLRQELQARTAGEASVVVAQSRQGASPGQGHPFRETSMPWEWADEEEIGQALRV